MIRYDRRTRALAAVLAALAGYVDAVGFVASGGFFVSFMSGNSTRLGVGLAETTWVAATAAGLIAAFVAGVAAGSLAGRRAASERGRSMPVVAVALTAAAALAGIGPIVAIAAAAFAMGAANTVLEGDGDVRIGVTYMTGALVKVGQRVAVALAGGARWEWVPYLLHWLALVAGAAVGAAGAARFGLGALWPAAAVAALVATRLGGGQRAAMRRSR